MHKRYNLLLLVIAIFLLNLVYIYYNLDVGGQPYSSDVIIVNEGMGSERAEKAIELFYEGYSDYIIVSPSLDYYKTIYDYNNIDEKHIIDEPNATSTWTNAVKSIEVMEENGWKSAIIITSDYHMRRTKLSYERAARDKDLTFYYVSAFFKYDGQNISYQKHPTHSKYAIIEVVKYVGYYFGLYHFINL